MPMPALLSLKVFCLKPQIAMILVANHSMRIPPSQYITFLHVMQGFDVADNEIVQRLTAGDLVITGDIPLAAEVIEQGGHALNPRGELYTTENIKARLSMRDFMEELRSTGVQTGGSAAMNQAERQRFANNLDSFLTRSLKQD